MTYHLYDKAECPFCWKVRLAMYFNGIDWESTSVDTDRKPKALLDINPRGTVPVLLANGKAFTDSRDIIRHITSLVTTPETFASARALTLEHYSDKTIGPHIRDAIFMRRGLPKISWDNRVLEQCQKNWITILEYLNCAFRGPWFLGDTPSVADCALAPRFALAGFYGLKGTSNFPLLRTWLLKLLSSEVIQATGPGNFQAILQDSINEL